MPRIQPLAYVAVEVRVPFMPRLAKGDVVEELGSGIPTLGVVRPEKRQRAIQDGNELRVELEEGWRFSDLSMTRSLIVTPTSVVYETTHYPGFESFSSDFEVCLRAVTETAHPVGYDRVGLRYVNEVWPPFPIAQFTDWGRWVAPDLISSLVGSESAMSAGEVPGIEPRLAFGEAVLNYKLPENCGLTLKVAMRQGEGVVGDAPLRRREKVTEPGPFFVVDFDGYWPRKTGEVRLFDESEITALLRTVHSPVKAGFRWTTTPEFISEVGVKDVFN